VAVNTLKSYRRDLARYAAYLASKGVDDPTDVTEAHVSDFLATLREGSAEHPPLAASSEAAVTSFLPRPSRLCSGMTPRVRISASSAATRASTARMQFHRCKLPSQASIATPC